MTCECCGNPTEMHFASLPDGDRCYCARCAVTMSGSERVKRELDRWFDGRGDEALWTALLMDDRHIIKE